MTDRQITGARSRSAGAAFEQLITASCNYYLHKNAAYIQKTPEPMRPISKQDNHGCFKAVFTKQAQPDFQGCKASGQSIVFEAKHTDQKKILRSRVTEQQLTDLIRFSLMGADAFVLVSFGFEKFYRVPAKDWYYMKDKYGRNYLTPSDLTEYEVEFSGGRLHFLKGW